MIVTSAARDDGHTVGMLASEHGSALSPEQDARLQKRAATFSDRGQIGVRFNI
jgi:hypothetical protein